MSVENAVVVFFAIAIGLVFVAAAVVLAGAIMTVRGLSFRAKAMQPFEVQMKLRRMPDDLRTLQRAGEQLPQLLARAAIAVVRIRAQFAALVRAFTR